MAFAKLTREIEAAIPHLLAQHVRVTGYSRDAGDQSDWIYIFARENRVSDTTVIVARLKIQPTWGSSHPTYSHLRCITTIERYVDRHTPLMLDARADDVPCADILEKGVWCFVRDSLAGLENASKTF